MPIRRTTSDAEIARYIDEKARLFRQACLNALMNIGEQAVNEARDSHRYRNQTGNLQSSIGYCVLEDGKVIFGGQDSFEVVKNGEQGSNEGRAFLQRLISEHPSGLVLIVVAGMEYAAYVEAKNLNVLDTAEQLAERELPRIMKSLKL